MCRYVKMHLDLLAGIGTMLGWLDEARSTAMMDLTLPAAGKSYHMPTSLASMSLCLPDDEAYLT